MVSPGWRQCVHLQQTVINYQGLQSNNKNIQRGRKASRKRCEVIRICVEAEDGMEGNAIESEPGVLKALECGAVEAEAAGCGTFEGLGYGAIESVEGRSPWKTLATCSGKSVSPPRLVAIEAHEALRASSAKRKYWHLRMSVCGFAHLKKTRPV